MERRVWHSHYPPGVPAEIDPDRYPSLAALCLSSCQRHADRIAFTNQGTDLRFGALDAQSRDFAARVSRPIK